MDSSRNKLVSGLIALTVIYLASTELLLHVLKFNLNPVLHNDVATYEAKFNEIARLKMHIVKIGFPVLWGFLAFVFLAIGLKKYNKTYRIVALCLIAVTLLKLFLYDIKDASEAGKILAFIILGVLLLVISFMYQKIKSLLLSDDEKERGEKKDI
jgi:uncharacterized membrane protein